MAQLLLISPVWAVELPDFFSAKVAVKDRSKESFKRGVRSALEAVLMKTSAASLQDIRQQPRIAQDIARADRLVEQFSYESKKQVSGDGVEEEQTYLKASFPEETIKDLLQQANFKYWSNNRPLALVWPVVKVDGQASLANIIDPESKEVVQAVIDASRKYGLPLLLPDASQIVNVQSLWRWNSSAIKSASSAYQADAIFVARMAITGDQRVIGGWLLIQNNKTESVDVNAESLEEFIDRGYAWLAKHWAAQYAVKLLVAENETLFIIKNIDSQQKYEAVLSYLENLDVIDRVYLLSVKASQLTTAIVVRSDLYQLQKILALDKQLIPAEMDEQNNSQLIYQWQE